MKNEHNDHKNHCPGAAPYIWRAENIDATRRLAEYLAQALKDHTETSDNKAEPNIPLVFFLSAPLGGGKTTFCRFVLQKLGWSGIVPSPSFGLRHSYKIPNMHLHLHHLDAYRIDEPGEFEELCDAELSASNSVLLIEWPEHIGTFPKPDIVIRICYGWAVETTTSAGDMGEMGGPGATGSSGGANGEAHRENGNARIFTITPKSPRGETLLQCIRQQGQQEQQE